MLNCNFYKHGKCIRFERIEECRINWGANTCTYQMKKVKLIRNEEKFKVAYQNMKNGIHPTGQDLWIFRRLRLSKRPIFLLSREEKEFCKHIANYLQSIPIQELNEEELFTLKILSI